MTTRPLATTDRVAWCSFMHDIEDTFRPYKLPATEFDHIVSDATELHLVTVADDGAIACYGMLRGFLHPSRIPMLGVATSRGFRGRGLATEMILTLHSKASDLGFARVGLHVDDHNEDAKRLYAKLGYKQEGDKWVKSLQ